ncbi:group II intron reverse transcriptase/maturase [Microvirga sp. KLBC 81]|uniref:group II intron reverse transcriptase/maturase n=1 Tax=Microvirga sp. KLBC 81 TaxID=1862707 RepID=UPI001FE0F62D|nr:group II intron reverse transcriptase/maturase [Microvirga sp. KLBC 81]
MSLQTPEKIRILQRKLYRKAKTEPAYRFYLLYDKIYRHDILAHAYRLARGNRGSPGVDGVTFAMIEAEGLEQWLADLRMDLATKTYQTAPVRRVMIPKPGGERPLGIPTVRDRVVQTATKLVLEPIFEADLDESAYGYRPKRSATDAVKEVHRLICRGYTDVVDADLAKFFDTIPHDPLIQSVAGRIVDRNVLHLIKMWLKAPIEEQSETGTMIVGGKSNARGTPQGGVVSPMLSNLYMNRFLKHWRRTGRPEAFAAHVVTYADDFVILSRGHAPAALDWTRGVMTRLGLTVHETKTSVRDARHEQFDFLGYTFGPHRLRKRAGHRYLGASPSKRSVQRLQDTVGAMLTRRETRPRDEVVADLNRVLRGWANFMSMNACVASWPDGTRCRPEESASSPRASCSGLLASSACKARTLAPGRQPDGEVSRRAGCRKSARPVR